MNNYEGYIHSNGSLMVVKVQQWQDSAVDLTSPFVFKYLGKKFLPSLNQAKQYFTELNGGKKYVDISELKKGAKN